MSNSKVMRAYKIVKRTGKPHIFKGFDYWHTIEPEHGKDSDNRMAEAFVNRLGPCPMYLT